MKGLNLTTVTKEVEIIENVRRFNEASKKNPNVWRVVVRQTSLWILDESTGAFGPNNRTSILASRRLRRGCCRRQAVGASFVKAQPRSQQSLESPTSRSTMCAS
jgi:hypothetical protein